mgnify:CR=1 FL=1
MDTCYLEFTGGIDDQGQPEPLCSIGIPVQISRQVEGDVVDDYVPVTISPSAKPGAEIPGRIVPDTRVVATKSSGVVEHLLARGDFQIVDPPTKKTTQTTADHRASRRANTRTEEQ